MTRSREYQRSSGVLLPAPSLPGPFGIGDIGPVALRWIDALAAAGQTWWQVLPVGPTGYGDSPYQSPSTFAGNLNLISPEWLCEERLASTSDVAAAMSPSARGAEGEGTSKAPSPLTPFPGGEGKPIDYTTAIRSKSQILAIAHRRFQAGDAPSLREPFRVFVENEASWLHDYSLFAAIKDRHGQAPWWQWPRALAMREAEALESTARDLDEAIQTQRFGQFLFFRQWFRMRSHAANRGVRLFGDLPIYVAEDSADVWRHPELFALDDQRRPRLVAGVPPDYFSATGQLWGNPIYEWDAHRQNGFRWWINRVRHVLSLFDQIRIDHFRGLEAFWAVPASHDTAAGGKWMPGPREALLSALQSEIGALPVVAEDLGFITPEVDALRERFGLPGMRILQFAFGGAVEERFLPHRFTRDLLVATGTHDNDTTRGWFDSLTSAERHSFSAYAPEADLDPVWALIRLGWASVAEQAIAPFQDLLGLGSDARLNRPGTASGNWRWRAVESDVMKPEWKERLADYGRVYERGKGNVR